MQVIRWRLILIIFLFPFSSMGQQSMDRKEADSLFLQVGAYPEAADSYHQLAVFWEQKKEADSAFQFYLLEAKALSQSRQWEAALEICERLSQGRWLRSQPQKLADMYYEQGFILGSIGRHREAIVAYDRAIFEINKAAEPDETQRIHISQYKGLALLNDGRPEEAEALILDAYHRLKRIWPEDTLALAYIANNVYLLYDAMYRYEQADRYVAEALRIMEKHLSATHPHIAFMLNNYSITRSQLGDPVAARDLLLQAIDQNKAAERLSLLAMNYMNLANLFADMGELEQAETYFIKSLAIGEHIFANPSEDRASLYDGLGKVAWYQNQIAKADSFFNLGLAQKKQLEGENSIEAARSYHNLGLMAIERKDWATGEQFFRQSLEIRLIKLGIDHPMTLESKYRAAQCIHEQGDANQAIEQWKNCLLRFRARQEPDYHSIPELAIWIARAYEQQGESDSTNHYLKMAWSGLFALKEPLLSWEEMANHAIRPIQPLVLDVLQFHLSHLLSGSPLAPAQKRSLCLSLIDQLHAFMPRLLPLLSYQHTNHDLAEQLQRIYAQAALLMHREVQVIDAQVQLFLLQCIENSNAFSVRIALQNRRLRHFAEVPDSLLEEDQRLRASIWALQKQKSVEAGKDDWVNQQVRAQDQWAKLQQQLARTHPDYFQLLYELPEVELEAVAGRLKDARECLLAYLQLDSGLLAITFDGREMHTYELPFRQEQSRTLMAFQQAIRQRGDIKRLALLGHKLHQALWAPVQQDLGNQIVLLPDGPLCQLNFELLVAGSDNPPAIPWLIRTHRIRYVSFLQSDDKTPPMKRRNLALAPAFTQQVKQQYLERLPDSLAADSLFLRQLSTPWSLALAKEMEKNQWGEVLMGAAATPARFRETAQGVNIIHFGTHAMIDQAMPLNSYLLLHPEPETGQDGLLRAADLYSLSLNNSLAVLSACQTGVGVYRQGEGILSLAHAFQYAGCPSLVYSLWHIDDQQTHGLIRHFYQHIDGAKPIATSLRQAKLSYLATAKGELAHPFYWGGLVSAGENRALVPSFFQQYFWLYVPGFLLLMTILFFRFRKK